MSLSDVVVLVCGLGLIGAELWYFLGPRRASLRTEPQPDGVQEVRVVVKDGYDPASILVEAGRPVRLLFYRDETADCSARVLLEDFGIDRALPPFETTAVEFTPPTPGDYAFHCAERILHGRVVAQARMDQAQAALGEGHARHA